MINANCVRPNPWLDRFFDEVERGFSAERNNYVPAVDVVETADAYNVRVELPGVSSSGSAWRRLSARTSFSTATVACTRKPA